MTTTSPATAQSTGLEALQTLDEYRTARSHVLRSETALEWLLRRHRERFIRSGALVVLGGRRFINPPVADRELLAIGAETAAESLVHLGGAETTSSASA